MNANEGDEPVADGSDNRLVNRDLCARDPLEDNLHGAILRPFASLASGAAARTILRGMHDELIRTLTALGLEPQLTHGQVVVTLPSERRGSFLLSITPMERALMLRAFIMRNPDRQHEAVYHRLLRRSFDATDWRFALDEDDDVYLVAYVPHSAAAEDVLDGLLGGACASVDAVFEGIARVGFDIPDDVSLRPPDSAPVTDVDARPGSAD